MARWLVAIQNAVQREVGDELILADIAFDVNRQVIVADTHQDIQLGVAIDIAFEVDPAIVSSQTVSSPVRPGAIMRRMRAVRKSSQVSTIAQHVRCHRNCQAARLRSRAKSFDRSFSVTMGVNTDDGILLVETQPPGRLWRLRATALCGLRREGQSASDRSVTPLSRRRPPR